MRRLLGNIMTKIKWNIFAEGECEESELPFKFEGTNTTQVLYTKCECPVCGEEKWIRQGLTVCDTCIP